MSETATAAGAVVGRIRNLIKKESPGDERVDVNAAIREVIELTRSEAMTNGVLVQTDLADGLPPVRGDRVELQQVILNLIVNALEAVSGMGQGSRELQISAGKSEPADVLVAVREFGPGAGPGRYGAPLQSLLHDQAEWLGNGAIDLPLDRRSARRADVGERQFASRRRLSIHAAVQAGRCIALTR